ncbi:N-acetylmannosamine-6-phosphate 2-epimerase [Dolosigranulum pigrum]|uniref:N-acetylmannosamine-6-phosphate 2-epimerase n=1 Tax=Dolosigranulum pigrum TaxID=29394 RepID=UPI000DBF90F1|nr:N-acetylmannosamine-6-phosphate 2-epimerase [Dolosigranulum pigrum]QTJ33616.1 N-acetylmannosamine-6-phosphate 2-epimerase [Dolosigranulum pigrum]QTJ38785.1 N-acetylmannosamine-6-phosphate 2-epimerase [Dolosigranulum pigrum]QTJ52396.1 N-acetylmannosamine-6-phosphate 2-epimerase [Dolosigranulum pigrum]RAN59563.1 N-acetylmannosamine-6-phosphate 2-epimerase [Dolosigranulum pigrum]
MERVKNQLIVSCQALEEEPLHSSFIMGRMAVAAEEGGAKGIRSNSVADVKEIKSQVDLPVIAIIKREYDDAEAFITPTIKEVDELMEAKPDVIAVDATSSTRPNGETLDEFFAQIKAKYPEQPLMADCSTLEEMLYADRLGFDYIGTTLVGYTSQSKGTKIETNDFEIIRQLLAEAENKVIAEGNINSPEKARRVLDLGCYSVVVGSSITRPQLITKTYADAINA